MTCQNIFDTIKHDLFGSKLKAYVSNENSVSFTRNYLTSQHGQTKIDRIFSGWKKIITRCPQGSILQPVFLNIFINDLFLFVNKSKICNYADDNILYFANISQIFSQNISQIINYLSNDFETLTK